MTKEQAYEKLELPVGTDLQVVRQKFQRMHNQFQVQIDGAFREDMRQKLQAHLMELEEAYAMLNESAGMDDSGSLPHTEKTFDPTGDEAKTQVSQQQASPPPSPHQKKEQEHAPVVDVSPPAQQKNKTGLFVGIVAGAIVVLAGAYFLSNHNENPIIANTDVHQDSIMWQSASAGNNEAAYQLYLEEYPEGIFAQAAKDSLAQISEKTMEQTAEKETSVPSDLNLGDKPQIITNTNWRDKYDNVWDFTDGVAKVSVNSKYGFVDKEGNIVIPLKYDNIGSFSEGLVAVNIGAKYLSGGKWGYMDSRGTTTIPISYELAGAFSGGEAFVQMNKETWGFIDKTGNISKTLTRGNGVRSFSSGFYEVKVNNKIGFFSSNGDKILPINYDSFHTDAWGTLISKEGLICVMKDGKWGFVNRNNKTVVPFKYDAAVHFQDDGLAAVKLGNFWGYIDTTGHVVIPFQYDDAEYFYKGSAKVNLNGKTFYINKQGKCVDDCPD